MDSVTQAVLGGAVAYAVLGKRLGKRAVIYGATLGTLPDLDVLIDFGDPIDNMTHHRGFSHSIVLQAIFALIIAYAFVRPRNILDPWFRRCWAGIYLCFFTHSLADLFTVYGTQILWPFTDYPFSHSILFIVDPLYTLPLVASCVATFLIKNQSKALIVNRLMLCISALYLVWSTTAKTMVEEKMWVALERKGITPDLLESAPAPLNTFLWRGVAIKGDDYFEIWTSVFDEIEAVQVHRFPRSLHLIRPVFDHPSVKRLLWFTKGQFKAWQLEDKILLSDLRMGVEGAYVFNFFIGRKTSDGFQVGDFEKIEQKLPFDLLGAVWRRILDPAVSISNSQ